MVQSGSTTVPFDFLISPMVLSVNLVAVVAYQVDWLELTFAAMP